MSSIEKILGIVGVGSTIANISLLKRFLSGVTVVIALTAISSTLAGMLMILGFYGLYLSLLHYGLQPQAAMVTVSGIATLITVALGGLAVLRWRQLRDMPNLMQESPVINQISKIAHAFVDGLLTDPNRRNL